jgi:hypothetical protein
MGNDRPDGWTSTRNLPLNWTWKEFEANRSLRGVRTDASWNSSFSKQWRPGRKYTSSRRMILGMSGVRTIWHIVQTDGTVDRWESGRDGTIVRTADRNRRFSDLQAESSETLLNSGIPCKTASFTYKWFCPNRMKPIILTVRLTLTMGFNYSRLSPLPSVDLTAYTLIHILRYLSINNYFCW